MIHLTLNTGDSRESPRREVNNTVITSLTPLVHLGVKPRQDFRDIYGELSGSYRGYLLVANMANTSLTPVGS